MTNKDVGIIKTKVRGPNKYRAKRCEYAGHQFASIGERDCFVYHQFLQEGKLISDLKCQIKVPLTAGITLRVDFSFFDNKLNEVVYAEYKGYETRDWILKKKLWKVHGPGLLKVYNGYGIKMKVVEEIAVSKH